VAISGKGGTGKTTLAALIIRWLRDRGARAILAVDADSNVNLNDVLGVPLKDTVGAIREEMRSKVSSLPGGMTKHAFLEYKIQSSLVETPEFDLIAMGRPEGPGCYCYANDLLRDILKTLGENYDFIVIDNEAGMEHLSRRTSQRIDDLFIVSDASPRGIVTAGRIGRLIGELDTRVGKKFLILNRVTTPLPSSLDELVRNEGLELGGIIPEDRDLLEMDRSGKQSWTALSRLAAYQAVGEMMKKLGF
jgi:CO dehydrogenase maturation factor